MKTFVNHLHHQHAGRQEMYRGRLVDCHEVPDRLHHVLAELQRRPVGPLLEAQVPDGVLDAALARVARGWEVSQAFQLAVTVGFTGNRGCTMNALCDHLLAVPTDVTQPAACDATRPVNACIKAAPRNRAMVKRAIARPVTAGA